LTALAKDLGLSRAGLIERGLPAVLVAHVDGRSVFAALGEGDADVVLLRGLTVAR
jgi:hypothetical protein